MLSDKWSNAIKRLGDYKHIIYSFIVVFTTITIYSGVADFIFI